MSVEVSVLQLIAYVALTMASVTITAVSAMFGYRQNFGWKPIILITTYGMGAKGGVVGEYDAIIKFEVWNRRKYPIVVRSINVQYGGLAVVRQESIRPGGWHHYRNGLVNNPETRLEPNGHAAFEPMVKFKTTSVDALDENIEIDVSFTDPISNKAVRLKATSRYAFK
jgi:hypothetical protein